MLAQAQLVVAEVSRRNGELLQDLVLLVIISCNAALHVGVVEGVDVFCIFIVVEGVTRHVGSHVREVLTLVDDLLFLWDCDLVTRLSDDACELIKCKGLEPK